MPTNTIEVVRATIDDLPQIVPLFDAYRQFYKAPRTWRARGASSRRTLNNKRPSFSWPLAQMNRAHGRHGASHNSILPSHPSQ